MPISKKYKNIISEKIGTFIWTFKKGDNIVYNFEILWALYEAKKYHTENKQLYNKPIIIIIISIIECVLEDFVRRIQRRSADPLPNITFDIIEDFKYKKKGQKLEIKKLEKFNHYIDIVKKHKIFGQSKKFYEVLHFLRNIRNKVHIQGSYVDEDRIFTNNNLILSQKVLKVIIKFMVEKYPRWNKKETTEDFPYPWREITQK